MNNSEVSPKIQILQFYPEHIANAQRLGSTFDLLQKETLSSW